MRLLRLFTLFFGLMLFITSLTLTLGHRQSQDDLWMLTFNIIYLTEEYPIWERVEILPNGHYRLHESEPPTRSNFPKYPSPDQQFNLFLNGDLLILNDANSARCEIIFELDAVSKYTDIEWSPDGEWILVSYLNTETSRRGAFVLRSDGSQQADFGTRGRHSSYTWARDGSWVVFQSTIEANEGGFTALAWMRPDGTQRDRMIFPDFEFVSSPLMVKDDGWILFTAQYQGSWQLYRFNIQTQQRQTLAVLGNFPDVSLSPSGDWIAYFTNQSGDFDLYRMRPDGSQNTRLNAQLNDPIEFGSLQWSPNGSYLYLIGRNNTIYLITPDGQMTKTQFPGHMNGSPQIVPLPTLNWHGYFWMLFCCIILLLFLL